MNIEIMDCEQISKWFKPSTNIESVLLDKIKESVEYKDADIKKLQDENDSLSDELDHRNVDIDVLESKINKLQEKCRRLEAYSRPLQNGEGIRVTLETVMPNGKMLAYQSSITEREQHYYGDTQKMVEHIVYKGLYFLRNYKE